MKSRIALIAIGLFLLTAATFFPVLRCGFVNYDDPLYISENPRVQQGLSWANVRYAFAHPQAGNWQPLTFCSLMLDRTLFGRSPIGFHATNLLLHSINAALVFLVLRAMTGMTWQSAIVAALFAVHPLRVESVAWACERKDVLSAFFGLCALAAYVRYARRPGIGWLSVVGVLMLLSLLAKATWVTLPLLMLLLDFWPLRRAAIEARFDETPGEFPRRPIVALLCEKLPLLAISVAASLATIAAQLGAAALGNLDKYPFADRLANAAIAYVRYLGKILYPANLAVFYPHQFWKTGTFLIALVCLAALTAFAISRWRRTPATTIGWLWFLIALLPMIGLVQSGAQSMADRFTYLPMIGLLIGIVWSLPMRRGSIVAAAVVVLALCITTHRQISHWQDSVSIYEHALAVTDNNHIAHNNLAIELARLGRTAEAKQHYLDALHIKPRYSVAHNGLGVLLAAQGDAAGAIDQYEMALACDPDYALAHRNLASQLLASGRADEAMQHLERAVALRPTDARAQQMLGIELAQRGRIREALAHFEIAVTLNPSDAQAQMNVGRALTEIGRPVDALAHFEAALRLDSNLVEAHYRAGEALARLGDLNAAAEQFRICLKLDPKDRTAGDALEQVLAHTRSASSAAAE